MYSNASSVVMMDGCISTSFPCKIGVRQGCPLSPILFSLYISDLESQISCESTGFITILNLSISTLIFAEDLALFADSTFPYYSRAILSSMEIKHKCTKIESVNLF